MKNKTILKKSLIESLKFMLVAFLAQAISTLWDNDFKFSSIFNLNWLQGELLVSVIIFPILYIIVFIVLFIYFKRKGKGK
ncbi:hypothetical protein EW093_06395 [Thiospirochaeta perfilievii]|uniref:Uncharacterized protein n=1 Tax=Thiospirochaeta perfilievii TaxID=252967 RepID=A0A5C1QA45_9SPIO|nr:hypothetical protein [Thiospirochaeta perfilievii]QEN04347.1 hypothetical protein EW093_06395 [Thiospirochaeta perfilievii]